MPSTSGQNTSVTHFWTTTPSKNNIYVWQKLWNIQHHHHQNLPSMNRELQSSCYKLQ